MINRFVDRSRPPGVSPISSEPSIVPHAGWRFSFFLFFCAGHGNTGANYQNSIFQKYAGRVRRPEITARNPWKAPEKRGGCLSTHEISSFPTTCHALDSQL